MSKIKYFYYYIFFNAYWSSFDMGERSVPRQNAVLYMMIIKVFFISGILFLVEKLGVPFNIMYALIIGVTLILILNRLLLSENSFNEKFDEYSFLKGVSKAKRMMLFWGLFGISTMLNIVGVYLSSK
ncbi:MAG: hypothetical protein KF845_10455 [Cyclobacteriaceae bacterium]|nr:hypothetical protein [Cyclobacteriaceae bacterium]